MKKIILIFAIISTTVLNAQTPIEKSIGEFTELKVYDLIEVDLIHSDDNRVVISGKNTEDVVVVNKNGTLKIRMTLEKSFDGEETSVTVHYTKIDIIDANEGAIISSKDLVKQFEIDLKAQEGGKVNIDVNVSYVNIKAVSGGRIVAKGKAKTQSVSINTGGVYLAEDLITESSKVIIKAAGEAHVNATEVADIKVRAGGSVFVYGNPITLKENKILGGKIKRVD